MTLRELAKEGEEVVQIANRLQIGSDYRLQVSKGKKSIRAVVYTYGSRVARDYAIRKNALLGTDFSALSISDIPSELEKRGYTGWRVITRYGSKSLLKEIPNPEYTVPDEAILREVDFVRDYIAALLAPFRYRIEIYKNNHYYEPSFDAVFKEKTGKPLSEFLVSNEFHDYVPAGFHDSRRVKFFNSEKEGKEELARLSQLFKEKVNGMKIVPRGEKGYAVVRRIANSKDTSIGRRATVGVTVAYAPYPMVRIAEAVLRSLPKEGWLVAKVGTWQNGFVLEKTFS